MSANDAQVGGTHYNGVVVQHWDYVEKQGLGYLEGQITKYLVRWRKKNGLQDLEKARHYLLKLMELYESISRRNHARVDSAVTREYIVSNGVGPTEAIITWSLVDWDSLEDLADCMTLLDGLIAVARTDPAWNTPRMKN